MGTIHYLRPKDKTGNAHGRAHEESARLKTAISQAQLAAVLIGETLTRSGILPAKVQLLIDRLCGKSVPPPRIAGPASERNPAVPAIRASRNTSASDAASANVVSASIDAFTVASVMAGTIRLNDPSEVSAGASEANQAALKLKSAFIAVPDDILVARQISSGQVAFCISSMDVLAATLGDILRQNRHMIETWAINGGRPALNMRHMAKAPFGRIAHKGAEGASDLRAVAVRISRESGARASYYVIELSLTPRHG